MNKLNRISSIILGSPLLWGSFAAFGFYYLLGAGVIPSETLKRYLAGHWVEYAETVLFFVALATLTLKAIDLTSQRIGMQQALLEEVPDGGQPVSDCAALLQQLETAPAGMAEGYLVRRLRDALEFVRRKSSAETLDEEIKYLADMDAVRAQHSYGFVRIIIWAIPILGFLGTVIGLTLAIVNLSPEALESSLPEVVGGLGTAFDTTATALAQSMILMFLLFVVERYESTLLAEVDARVSAELTGRFQETGSQKDPHLNALRRMLEAVVRSTEALVSRQSELWQTTIDAAHQRWSQLSTGTGAQLEQALSAALDRGLKAHAEQLAGIERAAAEQNRQHWNQVQQALLQSNEATAAQQRELRKQGEVLLKVVDTTREVASLENVLNQNLRELAGAKHFEETLATLSAAVHLLSAKTSHTGFDGRSDRASAKRSGQAA